MKFINRLDDLKSRYARYEAGQCKKGKNIVNPSLCGSSKDYLASLNSFIDETKKEATRLPNQKNRQKYPAVFPQVNHDYDYRTAAKIKYNPYNQGFTNEPSVSNLFSSAKNIGKYIAALVSTPLLDASSKAGQTDRWTYDSSNAEEVPPYPTFFTDYPNQSYPLSGVGASSYFIYTGMTDAPSFPDKNSCENAGFTWLDNTPNQKAAADSVRPYVKSKSNITNSPSSTSSGKCTKPRYRYIAGELNPGAGPLHSMLDDVMDVGTGLVSAAV